MLKQIVSKSSQMTPPLPKIVVLFRIETSFTFTVVQIIRTKHLSLIVMSQIYLPVLSLTLSVELVQVTTITYFYGGSNHPNKIFKFGCDESEVLSRIKFNFVGGTCASNNKHILLCFSDENKRLCYKSKSPLPKQWWQWFTFVDFSYATHDSIALSSGNR